MKVAFLSFDFGEYCIRLANALAREEEVLLMLPQQLATSHSARLNHVTNLHAFWKPRFRQPLRQIQMISQLLRHIRRFNPDVIHLQQGHMWFNFALPLLRRYPLVLTIHDARHHPGDKISQKTPQRVLDYGFHQAAKVIVHCKHLKQEVIDECRIPSEIIHVVPPVVDFVGTASAPSQAQEHDHQILFFGRIWEYKGLEYLIRAEPLITAQVPNARIVIAGQGEDFTRYQRLMTHPENFIVYNEFISTDMMTKLFSQASVVVLPYIEASQSGVIPIAYTFSKPVVATTVGGLPELVEDGRTGYLIPPRDEKALAEAIIRLLQDKDLRQQLGRNGKRKVDTECAEEVVAKKTLAVYAQALNGSRQEMVKGTYRNPI